MTKPARRIAAIAAAVVALAAVLYGMRANSGKETAGQCSATAERLASIEALEKGDVAAATSPKRPAQVVALDFLGPDGKATSLADFRGKVVLFNLWATWCVPCREEMPMLGSKDFEVVAVNIDTTRLERVQAFLREAKISSLAAYSDPKADTFYRLKTAGKALGLPTSILVGRDGCEIATMAGPANWASGDALALVKAAL